MELSKWLQEIIGWKPSLKDNPKAMRAAIEYEKNQILNSLRITCPRLVADFTAALSELSPLPNRKFVKLNKKFHKIKLGKMQIKLLGKFEKIKPINLKTYRKFRKKVFALQKRLVLLYESLIHEKNLYLRKQEENKRNQLLQKKNEFEKRLNFCGQIILSDFFDSIRHELITKPAFIIDKKNLYLSQHETLQECIEQGLPHPVTKLPFSKEKIS